MGEPTKTTEGRTPAPPRSSGSIDSDGTGPQERRAPGGHTVVGWIRRPRRPRLWFEVLLIGVSYWIYSLVRNAVPEQEAAAMHHADQIWRLESTLGINVEDHINHVMNSVTWLIVGMNYYYATLHFIMTIGVLVWLFRKHPGRYASARLTIFTTTAFALVGFYFFPLAPPRLMRGGDFVDTVTVHHTWGSMASGNLSHVSNQFAAMPSMHIGWSLWCGLTMAMLAKHVWVKVLGLLYPAVTLLVIISTANHFWLDAVGGVVCLAVGLGVSFLVYGRLTYRLPRLVPSTPVATPVATKASSKKSA
ncbi:phosphatase PAP2 family protein [Streptomyces sp. SL13]|uniref:Phosphatase PAP2 family protein n=1 Tax=Streptantibioticus silvisoli TaxID=2705255 RepID=A0AA90GZR8_9ACTN|nr:phosphatase PAP2 family protein [Streptantibioticus silvisoli]MDI5961660.1 phosphatase PAP2 family protein [Streptantibioticus silvisoli]MDI5968239.1 phosphatase PAP2 family protein [Streptantibioticus silvisoli]